jgi:hypothetical protein
MLRRIKMEIVKGNLKDDLRDMKNHVERMGDVETLETDLWRTDLIVDYIIKNSTIPFVSDTLVCFIEGCENIRDQDNCLCDEHLID